MSNNPRQVAFQALEDIYQNHAYTDIALDRALKNNSLSRSGLHSKSFQDRALVSELVYGIVRRKRTLDSIINQFASKKASQQPLKLRIILQLGLYQIRYLDKIPASAAVNTSVELAKKNGLSKISGVVNGILRSYLRQSADGDPLILPSDKIAYLGVKYSFPDWIVKLFIDQFSYQKTETFLDWFNNTHHIDLRTNIIKINRENLQNKLLENNIETFLLKEAQGLRLSKAVGNIGNLEEFKQGLFTIQDASAQLVTHLLNPQAGETIIDACAAPGGKTTHIAELMGDKGKVIAIDTYAKRLEKIKENATRLGLTCIEVKEGDSSELTEWENQADRVLVDVPCSGLGTLHTNPDIRWRKKPEEIEKLTRLQQKILTNASKWVKNGGILVYATCTLNQKENENIVTEFLANHPQWQLDTKNNNFLDNYSLPSKGMIKIFPPDDNMDGFFIAKLIKGEV
ncbi:16S rRNA (cytosine(967)-C(5))-methyltransferase [Cyanobacterium aponinum AL20118]|uniref:16S rRNA (cytosine(967)-C(5))-methyltransferase n=1 Tax=Cyanobacterium aponinum AL20115 TaxID=3090662 RepID=A0AAF1C5B7_9CHRO|nr:16S rRNA (cytosine(967)-C(5))-methyltransferase [Cyanobacterium aponinum]WPF88541.1 16S rRNA (cytosine(967)-C(5))-methyltransferase [Cyanobacterium aponinum AL20115]